MGFFNNGLFWFIEGLLAVLAVAGFRLWMKDRGVRLVWWKWIAFALWVLLAGLSIAFVGFSIGEGESVAAFRGGILFGLLTVLTGIGIWKALHAGRKQNKK